MNAYERILNRIPGRPICLAVAVALGMLCQPALAAARDRTVVRMSPVAEVSGERILLAQVADITGPDQLLADRLGRIDIGKAPLPGRKKFIESRYIIARMQKSSGGLPGDLGLEFPERLEVSRKAKKFPEKSLKNCSRLGPGPGSLGS